MAGGAGTGPVGGNIMFSTFNLRPVGHNMTVGAGLARRIKGKIIGAYFHLMGTWSMRCRTVLMAGVAGFIRPDCLHFRPNDIRQACYAFVILIMA